MGLNAEVNETFSDAEGFRVKEKLLLLDDKMYATPADCYRIIRVLSSPQRYFNDNVAIPDAVRIYAYLKLIIAAKIISRGS